MVTPFNEMCHQKNKTASTPISYTIFGKALHTHILNGMYFQTKSEIHTEYL